jgi:hypothetical protein
VSPASSALDLAWESTGGVRRLSLRGWSHDELRLLHAHTPDEVARRVRVLPSGVQDVPGLQQIAGEFVVDASGVVFTPRFPFLSGASYAVFVDGQSHGSITVDAPDATATTEVVAIYPTASTVPLNLLKCYVQFSAPMSEGWQRRAVHVRSAETGELLQDMFLPGGTELWDRARTRLTLLLDPGRIKRGLLPHEQMGYPLTECVPILLTVDATYRDASGRPLRSGAERRYEVGPPLRTRIDPAAWSVRAPAAGSRGSLVVEFDRRLDHALLQRTLVVRDRAGVELPGRASIGEGEQSWQFKPDEPWRAGGHLLQVDPQLEDLAGNSVTRVFDRDLSRPEDDPLDARHVVIEFVCK